MVSLKKLKRFAFSLFIILLVIDFKRLGFFDDLTSEVFQLYFKIAVLIFLILIFFLEKQSILIFKNLSIYGRIYIMIILLSMFVTISVSDSILGILLTVSGILIILLLREELLTDVLIRQMLYTFNFLIVLSFLFALVSTTTTYDFLQGKYRLAGITYGSHPLATIIALSCMIRLYFWKKNNWKFSPQKLPVFLFVLVSLYGLFLTDSRQAMIALLVSSVIFVWYSLSIGRKIVLSILLLGCILLLFNMDIDSNSFARSSSDDITTFTGRTYIWEQAILLIKEKPFFGYGFNAGQVALESGYSTEYGWTTRSAHNFLLQSCLDVGIIGSIFFVVWLFAELIKGFKFKFEFSLLIYIVIISIVERGIAGSITIYLFIFLFVTVRVRMKNRLLQV